MNANQGAWIVLIAIVLIVLRIIPGSTEPAFEPIDTDSAALIAQVESVQGDFIEGTVDGIAADPAPSPSDKPKAPKPEILIFVSKNCPPCERWKNCEMGKFMQAGWSVGIVEVHSYPITPRFEVKANGKAFEQVGFMSFETTQERVR